MTRHSSSTTGVQIATLLCILLIGAFPAPGVEIHVSPSGDDGSGDGSQQRPFASLFRAQQSAREAVKSADADVVVSLAPGDYRLDRPFTLTDADSGRNGHHVIYRSAGGPGKARLLASVPLTGWQKYTDGVWRIALPKGVLFHTLYENGIRADKARFPNHERLPDFPCARGRYLLTEDGTPKHHDRGGDVPKGPGWLIYPADEPPPPLAGTKTQLLIFTGGKCDWVRSMYKVRSIDPAPRKLVFEANSLPFGIGVGARFFLEDDMSFLDASGEFYVDEPSSTLYYKPMGKGHPDRLGITRPVINRMIQIQGTSPEKCVSNVRLEGLLLEETDCLPFQPMWAYTGDRDGALVWLTNASHVEIRNCHLKNGGRNGIMLTGHNTDNLVSGCWIEHMGQNGVSFVNRSLAPDRKSPTDKRCENNRVHNTHISHVGEIHTYAECVTVFHVSNNEVDHCQLDNSVRYAITVRGNTGTQYGPPVTNNYPPTVGNHFHHIQVSRCGQDGGDMGALHCANLNNPGGGSVNTFEQITVADTRAIPSVKDIGPDGIFLDWPKMAMDQVFKNVQIIRSQGLQLRSHGIDNGQSAQTTNVSWEPGFTTDKMDYDNIGLTATFSAEFGGGRPPSVPPPAPVNLRATTPAYNTVVLTWSPPDHTFGQTPRYTVFRDGQAIDVVDAPTFTDRNRQERTSYRYEITAQDGDFCHLGPRSEPCAVQTPPDLIPPRVTRVFSIHEGHHVRVIFSKPMEPRSIRRREAYRFKPAVAVNRVSQLASHCVELDVAPLASDRDYTLTISGPTDTTYTKNSLTDADDVPIQASVKGVCYDMQTTAGGQLLDTLGSAGEASMHGDAHTVPTAGPFGGPALILDGDGDFAEASSDFNLGGDDFTLMVWVWRERGGGIIASKGNGFGGAGQWSFGWPHSGPNSASLRVKNMYHSTAPNSVPIGQWAHVAFVKKGQTGLTYADGKPSGGPHDLSKLGDLTNDQPLRLGCRSHEPNPVYMKGKLAQFTLLPYALSAEEITAAAQTPTTALPP